jgi:hypothetical protein
MRKLARSLDRAAGELNPYLLMGALGLAVLDLLVLLVKTMPPVTAVYPQ